MISSQNPVTNLPSLRLLVLGGTGAVGQEVLKQALNNTRISRVTAPTRRELAKHPKLENPIIDFSSLPADAPWLQVDAVICALGTTIRTAGSQSAFSAIDQDLPIQFAQITKALGAKRYAFTSAIDASMAGNFYQRTKAEAEVGIRQLNFEQFIIVRPSLIDTKRNELRPMERIGLIAAKLLYLLIPKRYRPVKAESIALALLLGVLQNESGERIIESEQISDFIRDFERQNSVT